MKSRIKQTFLWGLQFIPTHPTPNTDVRVKAYTSKAPRHLVETGKDVFDISLRINSERSTVCIALHPDRYRVLPWNVKFVTDEIVDRVKEANARGCLVFEPGKLHMGRFPREKLLAMEYALVRKKNEQFGDRAIRTARGILDVFGVNHPLEEYLAKFEYLEQKELLHKKQWYSYPDYLRRKYRLG